MELLSQWRRGVVVGALVALTAAAAFVAPASASARSAGTSTSTKVVQTTGVTPGSSGKHHNSWEW